MSGPFPKYWDKASWDAYEAERATRIMPIGPKALQIMREVMAEQSVPIVPASTTYQYRDPDKRRAYMREYAKKRRALKAAEREAAKEQGT